MPDFVATPKGNYWYFACGFGEFPQDMLRYDNATIFDGPLSNPKGYIIHGKRTPTQDRWRSFNWSVAPLKVDGSKFYIKRGEDGHWEPLE